MTEHLKKCPFCAETIQAEAVKCRFCQSMLTDEQGNLVTTPGKPAGPSRPSFFRVFLWNVLAPGMGAIKLGHKKRGWIILGLMIVAMAFWTQNAVVLVNEMVHQALKSGKGNLAQSTLEKIQSGFWYDVMFYIYLLSFADLAFIFPWKEKDPPPSNPSDPTGKQ